MSVMSRTPGTNTHEIERFGSVSVPAAMWNGLQNFKILLKTSFCKLCVGVVMSLTSSFVYDQLLHRANYIVLQETDHDVFFLIEVLLSSGHDELEKRTGEISVPISGVKTSITIEEYLLMSSKNFTIITNDVKITNLIINNGAL